MDNINKKIDGFNGEEIKAKSISGMAVLIIHLVLMMIFILGNVLLILADEPSTILILLGAIYVLVIEWFVYAGLKVVKPNEAYVLTLFGKYYGTLRGPGFFFVNPFTSAVIPNHEQNLIDKKDLENIKNNKMDVNIPKKLISLKAITLNNEKQKINDELGNPIEIGIVVVWKVVNTAKAIFNVDDYNSYLSMQCDSALRNIVRLYPYDAPEESGERSLRGSTFEVAEKLKEEIQEKVNIAGLEIIEARITHLAYAPEIAAAMLQRQQASAIIDARKMIVDGAVGMVEMALEKLNENEIVNLDEERKAAMVSNLLVVLCGNKDAQPIVNSGSLY